MIPNTELLDDVIAQLDPEDIPVEFIIKAVVTDFDGNEHILRGDSLADFLDAPFNCTEVRMVLDVRKIRAHMLSVIEDVYAGLAEATTPPAE